MELAQANGRMRIGIRDPFYLAMAVVLTAIVVFGFSHTIPYDLAPPGLPWPLILHAGVFGAWMLLAIAQPALVFRGSLRLHRRLGWAGVALAVTMVVMGAVAILLALYADAVPPFYSHALFITRGFFGLVIFGGLVTAGIALRRQAGWHKRLMLCASIVVIVPALERALPVPVLGPYWPEMVDALADCLLLAGPVVDLVTRRVVHRAYIWGVGAAIAGQLAVDALTPSPVPIAALRALGLH